MLDPHHVEIGRFQGGFLHDPDGTPGHGRAGLRWTTSHTPTERHPKSMSDQLPTIPADLKPADGRFAYTGDDLLLDPSTALSFGLALHELASNAAQHGAFRNGDGRVEVHVRADGGELARLSWTERDGPEVRPPERKGFGTFLIETLLARELNADIRLDYPSTGLECVIERRPGAE